MPWKYARHVDRRHACAMHLFGEGDAVETVTLRQPGRCGVGLRAAWAREMARGEYGENTRAICEDGGPNN